MAKQHASYLSSKLKWLELVPKILLYAQSETDDPKLTYWINQHKETADEGIYIIRFNLYCIATNTNWDYHNHMHA